MARAQVPADLLLARRASVSGRKRAGRHQRRRGDPPVGGRQDRDSPPRATQPDFPCVWPVNGSPPSLLRKTNGKPTDDDRNDAPRFVESVWPHKTYPFVYGSIPQTWENPNVEHAFTGEEGDNDPIDL